MCQSAELSLELSFELFCLCCHCQCFLMLKPVVKFLHRNLCLALLLFANLPQVQLPWPPQSTNRLPFSFSKTPRP